MAIIVSLTLALATAGALLGMVIAKYSARRSTAQPITVVLDAEKAVLAAVLQEPGLYPALYELRSEMFAAHTHQRIWARIQEHIKATGQTLEATEQAALRKMSALVPADLVENVLTDLGPEDRSYAETLRSGEDRGTAVREVLTAVKPAKVTQKKFEKLLDSGAQIVAAHEDRENFQGSAPIEHVGSLDTPFIRQYEAPSRGRTVFTSVLTALGMALVPFLVLERTPIENGTAQLLAGAAIVLMLLSSVVVALVDWDTLYLDLPVFWVSALGIWGLTVLAQLVDDAPGRLLHGLGAILLMLFVIEGLLRVYSKLRGLPMQGGGDTQILFVTAGVPAALAASVMVGLFGGVIASGFLAVLLYGGAWLVGKYKKDQPFAFGPFLALGWVLGWAVAPLVIPGVYV